MSKPFEGVNVGTGPIDLREYTDLMQSLPVKIFLKENGALDNGPSFAILMVHPLPFYPVVCGQLSLKMFNAGLADIGYQIIKKP